MPADENVELTDELAAELGPDRARELAAAIVSVQDEEHSESPLKEQAPATGDSGEAAAVVRTDDTDKAGAVIGTDDTDKAGAVIGTDDTDEAGAVIGTDDTDEATQATVAAIATEQSSTQAGGELDSTTEDANQQGPLIEPWRPDVLQGAFDVLVEMLAPLQRQIAMIRDLAGPDRALLNAKVDKLLETVHERSSSIMRLGGIAVKQTKSEANGSLRVIRPGHYTQREQPVNRPRRSEGTRHEVDVDDSGALPDPTSPVSNASTETGGEKPVSRRRTSEPKSTRRGGSGGGTQRRLKLKKRGRGRPDSVEIIFDRVVSSPENAPLPKLNDFNAAAYNDNLGYQRFCQVWNYADDETSRLLYHLLFLMKIPRLHRYHQSTTPDKRQRFTLTMAHMEAMGIEDIAMLISHTADDLLKPVEIGVDKTDKFGPACLSLVRTWLHRVGVSLAGETWGQVDAHIKATTTKKK